LVVPGFGLIATLTAALIWLLWDVYPRTDFGLAALIVFFVAAVAGPVFLLIVVPVLERSPLYGSLPPLTLVVCVLALVATPAHPLFANRWAAVVTTGGLVLWLVCAFIVVGAPV
jgi:hypothetical protein